MSYRKRPDTSVKLVEYYENNGVFIWQVPFIKIKDENKWSIHNKMIDKGVFPKFFEILETEEAFLWRDLLVLSKIRSLRELKESLIEIDYENSNNYFSNLLNSEYIFTNNPEEVSVVALSYIVDFLKGINIENVIFLDDETMEEYMVNLDEIIFELDNGNINLMDYNRIITEDNEIEFIFYDYIALIVGPKERLSKIINKGEFEGFWPDSETTIDNWHLLEE